MDGPRQRHPAVHADDGRIVLIGGRDPDGRPSGALWVREPAGDRWVARPPLPVPIDRPACTPDGDTLVVWGEVYGGQGCLMVLDRASLAALGVFRFPRERFVLRRIAGAWVAFGEGQGRVEVPGWSEAPERVGLPSDSGRVPFDSCRLFAHPAGTLLCWRTGPSDAKGTPLFAFDAQKRAWDQQGLVACGQSGLTTAALPAHNGVNLVTPHGDLLQYSLEAGKTTVLGRLDPDRSTANWRAAMLCELGDANLVVAGRSAVKVGTDGVVTSLAAPVRARRGGKAVPAGDGTAWLVGGFDVDGADLSAERYTPIAAPWVPRKPASLTIVFPAVARKPVRLLVGERVRFTGGPYATFVGLIRSIEDGTHKVSVDVSIFGRTTAIVTDAAHLEPVELA